MAIPLNPIEFPLQGTRLIEASAGTGKTYTIAALYLRLVLGHKDDNGFIRPLNPPDILVVTFTNAATQELRERIRTRLTQAAAVFRGLDPGDPFLADLKSSYDESRLPAMARRLDQAALWMDEAAVHTIHAWCQRMLRQHAFDSLSLFDLELATDDTDLMEQAAFDYWRAWFYPLDPSVLTGFMETAGVANPHDLLGLVRPLASDSEFAPESGVETDSEMDPETGPVPSAANDPFELMARRLAAIERARRVWEQGFETAVGMVETARVKKDLNNNKYRKTSLDNWIAEMQLWVNGGGPLPGQQVLDKLSAAGLMQGVSKGKTAPCHAAFDALDQLNLELETLDIKPALIRHAAAGIRQRVDKAKSHLSKMDFNDLITRLDQALSHPESDRLARVIRQQFPVAMIDEFQDTDPVQYRIFSRVYLDQPDTGLFMIGDPKQAIYAFRGADIYTYLCARTHAGSRHYTLDTNYRSTRGMVSAVNRIFGRARKFDPGAFLFERQIDFEPVKVQGRKEIFLTQGRALPSLTFWVMDQDGPVNKTGPDGYIHTMAEAAAGEITRLINQARTGPCNTGFAQKEQGETGESMGSVVPLRPSDIAVLVRDGKEAAAIKHALTKRQVRSVYLSESESVFKSAQARSILALLQACAQPGSDRLLRAALAVPLLNLSFERLDRLNRDEAAWEAEVDRFRTFRAIWQTRGVLPMIRALLSDFYVGTMGSEGESGERQMTNVLHLAELLQTAAASLDGEQGLIRWLTGKIAGPDAGGEDQIIRLESDEELVRVVTIHKSKGLEYPLVFLPFICSFRGVTRKNTGLVRYHDPSGKLCKVMDPDTAALEQADHERLAEDIRMLYVALTRPRHACWLGMGVMGRTNRKTADTSDLHRSAMGYVLDGGNPISAPDLADLLKQVQQGCDDIAVTQVPVLSDEICRADDGHDELKAARVFTGHIPLDWRITSYSGILVGAAMADHTLSADRMVAEAFTAPQDMASLAHNRDIPETACQDQLMETLAESGGPLQVQSDARSIHTFPRGPEPGTFLHDLLEWAAVKGFDRTARDPGLIRDEIARRCNRRGWESWIDTLSQWFGTLILADMGAGFSKEMDVQPDRICLGDLDRGACLPEMEFMFSACNVSTGELDRLAMDAVLPGMPRPTLRHDRIKGMLKGFIDLVFCVSGRYFVLDYKSNHLGDTVAAYDAVAMAHAMTGHRYDLQYLLYTLALHRLLCARLPGYDYDLHVGGVVYLFLRGAGPAGQGIYAHKPSKAVVEALDVLFKEGHD